MIELIDFTELSNDEKVMVLEWRNHINIREWMFTQELISLEKHLSYIDSLAKKTDRLYFLVKKENEPIGVIDFTSIDTVNGKAEIGLYAKPNLKRIGSLLMYEIVAYAFKKLKVKVLISEMLDTNISAIKLYKEFNFEEISRKENIIVMELKNENR